MVLQKDNWDDFGFKTQYHLWVFDKRHTGFVGNVKMHRLEQGETPSGILPLGPLQLLPDDFRSIGQSLDYYERLATLPADLEDGILSAPRDAIAFPDHARRFADEYARGKSVTRDLDVASFGPLVCWPATTVRCPPRISISPSSRGARRCRSPWTR